MGPFGEAIDPPQIARSHSHHPNLLEGKLVLMGEE